MDDAKRKALEAAGFKIGTVQEFLGLTDEESQAIEASLETRRRAIRENPIVTTYHFTFTLAGVGELTDKVTDALHEAGCDDCTPSSCEGIVSLTFDREAESLRDAMDSAEADVERAGLTVELVRMLADDLPGSTAEDRARLRAAMDGPIDTSDIPEHTGPFRRIRRDASGRILKD